VGGRGKPSAATAATLKKTFFLQRDTSTRGGVLVLKRTCSTYQNGRGSHLFLLRGEATIKKGQALVLGDSISREGPLSIFKEREILWEGTSYRVKSLQLKGKGVISKKEGISRGGKTFTGQEAQKPRAR